MSRKEVTHDIDPGRNDFFLPEPGLQSELGRELTQDFTDWKASIWLFIGLGETAPLFQGPLTKGVCHDKKGQPRRQRGLS